jgi:hypothetical protein
VQQAGRALICATQWGFAGIGETKFRGVNRHFFDGSIAILRRVGAPLAEGSHQAELVH